MSDTTVTYSALVLNATQVFFAQLKEMCEQTGVAFDTDRLVVQQTPLYPDLAWLGEVAERRAQHTPVELIQADYPYERVRARAQALLTLLGTSIASATQPAYTAQISDPPMPPLAFMRSPMGVLIAEAIVAPLHPLDLYSAAEAQQVLDCELTMLDDFHDQGRMLTLFPGGVRSYIRSDVEALGTNWRKRPRQTRRHEASHE